MTAPGPEISEIQQIFDVLIIGAGPSGLAAAARLREHCPSALFTDEEQRRYSWASRHANRAAIKNKRDGRIKTGCHYQSRRRGPSILVLDESGTAWMDKWKTLFKKLEISHLRSPMFFHPDPSDRDALLAFCHETGRSGEVEEIAGCVGKEISKHKKKKGRDPGRRDAYVWTKAAVAVDERDRKDYFTPSATCFEDFCQACIRRYGLDENLIRKEVVEQVEYKIDIDSGCDEALFRVKTATARYVARTVILAIGPGEPIIPKPFATKLPSSATHVIDTTNPELFGGRLLSKMRSRTPTNVLVVGGGLTAAQTADACIRKGVDKVSLLMRGHWKVKPFDVDLSWMSKFRNQQRSVFWSADTFEERMTLAKEARNGGSITPRFSKLLKEHIQAGRLLVHTNTAITSASYDDQSESWTIATDRPTPDLLTFDHIFFATGTASDIRTMPLLEDLLESHPIQSIAGLPVLNDNLAWSDEVPLFVTGKLAMLQLGPGAGNLEGARLGAERVAWAIEETLARRSDGDLDDGTRRDGQGGEVDEGYISGAGSKFSCLIVDEDDEDDDEDGEDRY